VELNTAVQRLGALAHDTRLSIFRLLVRRGALGLPAGEIATHLELAPPNASFHLAELARAGLIAARRDGRNVIYAVDFSAMARLMDYLRENCCADETFATIPLRAITRRRSHAGTK
jgi:ArsR family transcriptional regulator